MEISTNYPEKYGTEVFRMFHNVLYGGVNVLNIYGKGVLTTSSNVLYEGINNVLNALEGGNNVSLMYCRKV